MHGSARAPILLFFTGTAGVVSSLLPPCSMCSAWLLCSSAWLCSGLCGWWGCDGRVIAVGFSVTINLVLFIACFSFICLILSSLDNFAQSFSLCWLFWSLFSFSISLFHVCGDPPHNFPSFIQCVLFYFPVSAFLFFSQYLFLSMLLFCQEGISSLFTY